MVRPDLVQLSLWWWTWPVCQNDVVSPHWAVGGQLPTPDRSDATLLWVDKDVKKARIHLSKAIRTADEYNFSWKWARTVLNGDGLRQDCFAITLASLCAVPAG